MTTLQAAALVLVVVFLITLLNKVPVSFSIILSALVTIIIMLVGIRSIYESIRDILSPHEAPDYNLAVILIMGISMAVKLVYGGFLRKKGKQIKAASSS